MWQLNALLLKDLAENTHRGLGVLKAAHPPAALLRVLRGEVFERGTVTTGEREIEPAREPRRQEADCYIPGGVGTASRRISRR
jgi:hypothetical protein